jgi:hypothetical protein
VKTCVAPMHLYCVLARLTATRKYFFAKPRLLPNVDTIAPMDSRRPEGEVESSRYLPVKTGRSGRSLADPIFHTAKLMPCSTNRR